MNTHYRAKLIPRFLHYCNFAAFDSRLYTHRPQHRPPPRQQTSRATLPYNFKPPNKILLSSPLAILKSTRTGRKRKFRAQLISISLRCLGSIKQPRSRMTFHPPPPLPPPSLSPPRLFTPRENREKVRERNLQYLSSLKRRGSRWRCKRTSY